jgi:hypothetical protein
MDNQLIVNWLNDLSEHSLKRPTVLLAFSQSKKITIFGTRIIGIPVAILNEHITGKSFLLANSFAKSLGFSSIEELMSNDLWLDIVSRFNEFPMINHPIYGWCFSINKPIKNEKL